MSRQPDRDLPRENMQEHQVYPAIPADEALLRALTQRSAQMHDRIAQARALRLERAWVESMRTEHFELAEYERLCAEKLRAQVGQGKSPERRS